MHTLHDVLTNRRPPELHEMVAQNHGQGQIREYVERVGQEDDPLGDNGCQRGCFELDRECVPACPRSPRGTRRSVCIGLLATQRSR